MADTSDADTDYRNTPVTSDNMNNNRNEAVNSEHKQGESEKDVVNNYSTDNTKTSADSEDYKENESKGETVMSENIKHNTQFYNPDKLNKGQYTEVKFKNDLIFDLDM